MDKFLRYSPLILFFFIIILAIGLSNNYKKPVVAMSRENYEIQTHTIDSLQDVVSNLQSKIHILEDGFDTKEHRYEEVIGEYEFGLSYLKEYHPKAYKDFHRIIGFKERYSFELERENKKRLNINE